MNSPRDQGKEILSTDQWLNCWLISNDCKLLFSWIFLILLMCKLKLKKHFCIDLKFLCFVDFLNFDSNCVGTKIVGLLQFHFHCECR